MVNSPIFWIVSGAIWLALVISSFIKSWHKGGWKVLKWDMKNTYNYLVRMLNGFLGLYVVIIMMIPYDSIKEWLTIKAGTDSFVNNSVLYVYGVLVILISLTIVIKGLIPSIKLNAEEQILEDASNKKSADKIRKIFGIKPKANKNDIHIDM